MIFSFHQELSKYVDGGCLLKKDVIISFIYRSLPFYYNAKRIIEKFNNSESEQYIPLAESTTVNVDPYSGKNPYVLKMCDYLSAQLSDELIGAYVHGSLATGEEINYSDFDALVIVKNDIFMNSQRLTRVAKKLNGAQKIMCEFDPLQHHGWFVLTERDLKNYPQTYFPVELFHYAKSLFKDQGLSLTMNYDNEKQDYVTPFDNLTKDILKRLKAKDYPNNVYQLKGLFSQFMLIPSLYVQARDKRGVYKRLSFEEAKKDFDQNEWEILDKISAIRQEWSYDISNLKRAVMTRIGYGPKKLKEKFAPNIPGKIKRVLDDEFFGAMEHLAILMNSKIQRH